ncbi:MAG TPA: group 1 truncated hemoglobin [Candidatus Manganitrophaceae bacterium]|nr:group 1 truncated hemoglobin [Candidatus Manganitrophaceae bacterium]
MKATFKMIISASLLIWTITGCAGARTGGPDPTLYQRLGGKGAIEAVVADFLARLGNDARITNEKVKARMATVNHLELKARLTDLVCEASGGPCKYSGRSMKEAHAGLRISPRDFDITVEDLVTTLDQFKVPEKEKNDVLALLGPLKQDIVEAP